VEVPVGSQAEVYLPVFKLRNLKLYEGQTLLWADDEPKNKVSGLDNLELKGGNFIIRVGSGTYHFVLEGE
jgi:hypothetical protein